MIRRAIVHTGDAQASSASEHHRRHMNQQLSGVVLCKIDDRHDERWALEAIPRLVETPGVDGIDVERTRTSDGQYLQLAVEFASTEAWERFVAHDCPCGLLSNLEAELEPEE